jgi:hypothetical protein
VNSLPTTHQRPDILVIGPNSVLDLRNMDRLIGGLVVLTALIQSYASQQFRQFLRREPVKALLESRQILAVRLGRGIICERVSSGLAAARERSVKLGRPGTLAARRAEVFKLKKAGLASAL